MAVLNGNSSALTTILITVVLFLVFTLVSWYYWSHRKILRVAWDLPAVIPALPVVGHGYLVLRGTQWLINYVIQVVKEQQLIGILKGVFWVGPYPVFLVTDPDDVYKLLNNSKSLEGGLEHPFFQFALGNGLVTAPAHVWKVTRRHVSPLLHPRNLELMYASTNQCARDLVSALSSRSATGSVDVEPLIYPVVLKSTCKLVFGEQLEIDVESEKFKKLMEAITRISYLTFHRLVKFYAWPELVFRLMYKDDIKEIEDGCDGFITDALQESRRQRLLIKEASQKQFSLHNDDKQTIGETTQITLEGAYRVLQEKYPVFTDKDLNYEVRNLLFGGSETSKVTLSSCLLALAAHPHIQDKLYAEIVAVTGPHDSDVTSEHIHAMPYLDQVLKETLRKFLITPLITRSVQEDIKLKDWVIPKGSAVGILTFAVHFNPKLYPDPERFDPDHFSPEKLAARGKHGFIAFSGGPRNCIGKNFAVMEMKIFLVHVIKKFRFSTTVDVNRHLAVVGGAITSLEDGYMMEVEERL